MLVGASRGKFCGECPFLGPEALLLPHMHGRGWRDFSAKSPAAEIKDFPQTEVNRGWGKFSGERPLLGPKAMPRAWAGALLLRACARVFC